MSRLPGYCLGLALVSPIAISVGHCEPVALESFFKTPQYPQMVLSPDGQWVATLVSANGATNLDVIDLDGKTARAVTGYEAPETVQWVFWKSDIRLKYGAQRPDRTGFLVDTLGVISQDGSNHMMLSDSRQPLLIGKSIQRERPSEELQFGSNVIDERRDSEYLHERSPLYNVEKIHAPVFLAHGEDDWIVPLSDSVRLRNALEAAAHKEVEFLSKPDEGHGFSKEGNNIELYERIEKFLQKNNPAT
jgi:pimeloyl-ACP methyl ester carboxylesterase